VPIVLKSGSLNLLEPSGLVQACNGIVLPLPLFYMVTVSRAELHSVLRPSYQTLRSVGLLQVLIWVAKLLSQEMCLVSVEDVLTVAVGIL